MNLHELRLSLRLSPGRVLPPTRLQRLAVLMDYVETNAVFKRALKQHPGAFIELKGKPTTPTSWEEFGLLLGPKITAQVRGEPETEHD